MKRRSFVLGLILGIPLTLHGQRLEVSQMVLSYDWYEIDQNLMRLENRDDAICLFSRIVERDPHDAVATNNLGVAYAVNDDYAAALFALRKAVRLAPDNRVFQRNLDRLRDKTRAAWRTATGGASSGDSAPKPLVNSPKTTLVF